MSSKQSTRQTEESAETVLTVARCDCRGRLLWGTEQTERGLRWTYTCELCGRRWGNRDGIFGPLDRDPAQELAEAELLACFRRLPPDLQPGVISHLRSLAHPHDSP